MPPQKSCNFIGSNPLGIAHWLFTTIYVVKHYVVIKIIPCLRVSISPVLFSKTKTGPITIFLKSSKESAYALLLKKYYATIVASIVVQ